MTIERKAYMANIDTEECNARQALAFAKKNLKKHKRDLRFAYAVMASSAKENEAVANLLVKVKAIKTTIVALKKQLPKPPMSKWRGSDSETKKVLISAKCVCKYNKLNTQWKYCPDCGQRINMPKKVVKACFLEIAEAILNRHVSAEEVQEAMR